MGNKVKVRWKQDGAWMAQTIGWLELVVAVAVLLA